MAYQKFIILSSTRSGSTLLASLLRSNEKIISFGEFFITKHKPVVLNYKEYSEKEMIELKYLRDKEPIKFIDNFIFKDYGKRVKAVGFKIFYNQARRGSWKSVWPHLRKKNLKIIHLKRLNKLRTFLSFKIAKITGQWRIEGNERRINPPNIKLKYRDCLRFFEKLSKAEKNCEKYFKDKKILIIYYEDLIKNQEEITKKVQKFLGLEPFMLKSNLKKQELRKLPEAIKNYSELKEEFKGTEWETFLNESSF